jgi:hypothetical protein
MLSSFSCWIARSEMTIPVDKIYPNLRRPFISIVEIGQWYFAPCCVPWASVRWLITIQSTDKVVKRIIILWRWIKDKEYNRKFSKNITMIYYLGLAVRRSSTTSLSPLICFNRRWVSGGCFARSSKNSMTASLLYNFPSWQLTIGFVSDLPEIEQNVHFALTSYSR